MKSGSRVNRRRSRSRARNRDVWTRIPQWISLPYGQTSSITESEQESSSCQLCEGPTLASRLTQKATDNQETTAVSGPANRARPRSRSVNRARFRKPLPVDEFEKPTKIPQIRTLNGANKHRSNIQCQTYSSGSSSEPEPINSPSLSRISSTLSSDSVAELFPFDSEIFVDTTQIHNDKPNGSVTKKNDEMDKNKGGVVAIRNPNIVAICAPRMITKHPLEIACDVPDKHGPMNASVPSTPPPELTDVVENLRFMTRVSKNPPDDASKSKIDRSKDKIVAVQTTSVNLECLPRISSADSTSPNTSAGASFSITSTSSTSKPFSVDPLKSLRKSSNATEYSPLAVAARSLKFCCQLAHGSPTAIISNFASVDELFQSIAECFNISADDIIFCTINTFKPDMDKLFAGNLEYSDMLFAHIKGQPVEVELTKTEGVFGLTVSDNGRCRSFIKRMKENSIVSRAKPALAVGQLIECIDGVNVTGMRHFEVVRILRNMPIGKTFVLRVISPKQSGFQQIAPRSMNTRKKDINDGMRTLRFKANGGVVIEEGVVDKEMIARLNDILDSYLGVQDDQMAQSLLELAHSCETLPDMNRAVRESELSVFDFPDELVFDMWGVVGDSRRKQNANKDKNSERKLDLLEDDEEKPLMPLFS